jgi:hypothetical protein
LAEFAPAELGAVLGVAPVTAALLIGDALDLRHRLPLIWAATRAGQVKLSVARMVAKATHSLSAEAAAQVDQKVAPIVATLPYGRLARIVEAEVLRADTALAKARAAAAVAGQGVWIGQDVDHGYGTIFGRAAMPDLRAVDTSLDTLARAMTVLGDTDSHDVRRAKALAVLADPRAALELTRLANETLTGSAVSGPHDGGDPRRGCDLGSAVLYVHLTQAQLTQDQLTQPQPTGRSRLCRSTRSPGSRTSDRY